MAYPLNEGMGAEEKRKRFGKLLQRLRGPDVEEFRYKSALSRIRNERREQRRRRRQGIEPEGRSESLRDQKTDEERAEELELRVWLPIDFREYHRYAAHLKVDFISLREAAKLIGINKNTLHDYERGKRYPPAEFVFDYCAALGLSAERLMRDWIGLHPNPNVNKYADEGRYKARDMWKAENGLLGPGFGAPEDENTVQFIAAAIKLAAFIEDADLLWGEKIHHVAYTAADIIYDTLSDGHPPSAKYIQLSNLEYPRHESEHKLDEDGNIIGKHERGYYDDDIMD